MLKKMPSHAFSFEKWSAGSLMDLGIETRLWSISQPSNRDTIRNHAIGYCHGKDLQVRIKPDTIAVMFEFEGDTFWTHLTVEEFEICFPLLLG